MVVVIEPERRKTEVGEGVVAGVWRDNKEAIISIVRGEVKRNVQRNRIGYTHANLRRNKKNGGWVEGTGGKQIQVKRGQRSLWDKIASPDGEWEETREITEVEVMCNVK